MKGVTCLNVFINRRLATKMGATASIEKLEYDEEKFKQSREILESEGDDDQQKFIKLKAIWEDPNAATDEKTQPGVALADAAAATEPPTIASS